MADTDVQFKALTMEKERSSQAAGPSESQYEPTQDTENIPLSLLLEQMGSDSLLQNTEHHSDDEESFKTADSQFEEGDSANESDAVTLTLDVAIEKMGHLDANDFLVPEDQQLLLNQIPEWKDGYIPPVESSSDCQTSNNDSPSARFEPQEATLQAERCQNKKDTEEGRQVVSTPACAAAGHAGIQGPLKVVEISAQESISASTESARVSDNAIRDKMTTATLALPTIDSATSKRVDSVLASSACEASMITSNPGSTSAGPDEETCMPQADVTEAQLVMSLAYDSTESGTTKRSDAQSDLTLCHPDVSFSCSSAASTDSEEVLSSDSLGADRSQLAALHAANQARLSAYNVQSDLQQFWPESQGFNVQLEEHLSESFSDKITFETGKDSTAECIAVCDVIVSQGFATDGLLPACEMYPIQDSFDISSVNILTRANEMVRGEHLSSLCNVSKSIKINTVVGEYGRKTGKRVKTTGSTKVMVTERMDVCSNKQTAVKDIEHNNLPLQYDSSLEADNSEHTSLQQSPQMPIANEYVYHSTQKATVSESQCTPLDFNLSPIMAHTHHSLQSIQVVAKTGNEVSRLKALEKDPTRAHCSQKSSAVVFAESEAEEQRLAELEKSINIFDATGTAKSAVTATIHSSEGSVDADNSLILVEYSGSESGDSCKNCPLQKANPPRKKEQSAMHSSGEMAHSGSSGETTVIPDSGQEDVIVISSGESLGTRDKSSGETTCISNSAKTTALFGQEEVIVISSGECVGSIGTRVSGDENRKLAHTLASETSSPTPSPDSSTHGSQLEHITAAEKQIVDLNTGVRRSSNKNCSSGHNLSERGNGTNDEAVTTTSTEASADPVFTGDMSKDQPRQFDLIVECGSAEKEHPAITASASCSTAVEHNACADVCGERWKEADCSEVNLVDTDEGSSSPEQLGASKKILKSKSSKSTKRKLSPASDQPTTSKRQKHADSDLHIIDDGSVDLDGIPHKKSAEAKTVHNKLKRSSVSKRLEFSSSSSLLATRTQPNLSRSSNSAQKEHCRGNSLGSGGNILEVNALHTKARREDKEDEAYEEDEENRLPFSSSQRTSRTCAPSTTSPGWKSVLDFMQNLGLQPLRKQMPSSVSKRLEFNSSSSLLATRTRSNLSRSSNPAQKGNSRGNSLGNGGGNILEGNTPHTKTRREDREDEEECEENEEQRQLVPSSKRTSRTSTTSSKPLGSKSVSDFEQNRGPQPSRKQKQSSVSKRLESSSSSSVLATHTQPTLPHSNNPTQKGNSRGNSLGNGGNSLEVNALYTKTRREDEEDYEENEEQRQLVPSSKRTWRTCAPSTTSSKPLGGKSVSDFEQNVGPQPSRKQKQSSVSKRLESSSSSSVLATHTQPTLPHSNNPTQKENSRGDSHGNEGNILEVNAPQTKTRREDEEEHEENEEQRQLVPSPKRTSRTCSPSTTSSKPLGGKSVSDFEQNRGPQPSRKQKQSSVSKRLESSSSSSVLATSIQPTLPHSNNPTQKGNSRGNSLGNGGNSLKGNAPHTKTRREDREDEEEYEENEEQRQLVPSSKRTSRTSTTSSKPLGSKSVSDFEQNLGPQPSVSGRSRLNARKSPISGELKSRSGTRVGSKARHSVAVEGPTSLAEESSSTNLLQRAHDNLREYLELREKLIDPRQRLLDKLRLSEQLLKN